VAGRDRVGQPEARSSGRCRQAPHRSRPAQRRPRGDLRRERRRLRLAALVHDAFKNLAPEGGARVGGEGHHGTLAARFLERFVDDEDLIEVVRWQHEAFAAWLGMVKCGDRRRAEQRVRELVKRLGDALPLYLRFFRADNATEGKSPDSVEWFESMLRESAPAHALELTRARARGRSHARTT
jgi:hypothetical protein